MNEIEQNYVGDVMCVPYSDDGNVRALIFTNTGKKIVELNMNKEFNIDKRSVPIMGLFNPMITACFIENDDMFIAVFHRLQGK